MTTEERIEKLDQAIQLVKNNPCHISSGPAGGQFCPTGGGGRSVKSPSIMSSGEINHALDRSDKQSSKVNAALIAAGRGNELPSETRTKSDKLSMEWKRTMDERSSLRNEITRRYGPNAPSRLPKGFRPLR